jgi:tripartite-type tricarboxylate transporter receptor subunit TctC
MNWKLHSTMLLALCLCVTLAARAQSFPDKPVRLVVGAGAGSFPDHVARRLADGLSAQWGQPIVIENRPGAGGIAAMSEFARAPADGYTLALATMSQLVFNRHLFHGLPYDPRAGRSTRGHRHERFDDDRRASRVRRTLDR